MENTMKAARLNGFHRGLDLEELAVPKPGPGQVLAKVLASGLCASDLHIMDGQIASVCTPYTPGHEMYAEIVELGGGTGDLEVGQRFCCGIDVLCGTCRHCRSGRGHLCLERRRIGFELDGSHAQYCVVPVDNVFRIDPTIPPEQAAIIPDAVACMYHAIKEQGQVKEGDIVCLLGIGGLGLQGVQIAKHFGATVISTSRQDKKLEIAQQFGSDFVINTAEQDLLEEVRRITDGAMCDVVFDNIGIETSVQSGVDIICRGGKVVVVGYGTPTFTVNYQNIVVDEKEIIGIRGSKRTELREAITLVEQGVITPFIHRTYRLDEINEALDDLRSGASLGRTVVLPWE